MKTVNFFIVIASTMLFSANCYSQDLENCNPYSIFGSGFMLGGWDSLCSKPLGGKPFVVEGTGKDGEFVRMEHNPRSGLVRFFDKDGVVVGQKQLSDLDRAWPTPDPLAGKYLNLSPYNYCAANPIKFIDPDGMDVYRFDNVTGSLILVHKTDYNFDQIGKFRKDSKTGEYSLQRNRKGNIKTRMDNIEKGILKDGINFKTQDNLWNVGGDGQPTVEGFQNFVTEFAGMVGKEMAGYYLTTDWDKNNEAPDVSHIYMASYSNNESDMSQKSKDGPWDLSKKMGQSLGVAKLYTDWHTHPGNQPEDAKYSTTDMKAKQSYENNYSLQKPSRFIILTMGPETATPY